ncbi:hypothetical protein Tsubulata_017311 [Turnera subulata]|uniref:Uncharacterized protein n=1 Tax=Turnera subulata TaxID=218843 RepID=A0A9Q0IWM7_9ROSI|nr:hypothetical protein Tsubulata_017311 [Turnera subulata]
MGSEAKGNGSGGAGAGAGAGGFKSRMEHYLYSGDKKHVMAGIVIISAIFGVPWYLRNRVTEMASIVQGQSISPIKITWKKLIKHVNKDCLQVQVDEFCSANLELQGLAPAAMSMVEKYGRS